MAPNCHSLVGGGVLACCSLISVGLMKLRTELPTWSLPHDEFTTNKIIIALNSCFPAGCTVSLINGQIGH